MKKILFILLGLLLLFGCSKQIEPEQTLDVPDTTSPITQPSSPAPPPTVVDQPAVVEEEVSIPTTLEQVRPQEKGEIYYIGNRAYTRQGDTLIKYTFSRENNTLSIVREAGRWDWDYFLNNQLDGNTERYRAQILEKFK